MRKGLMSIEKVAFLRLKKLSSILKREVPKVVGLKLSGSVAEGHYFYLQFGEEYVSSDYDVVVLLKDYPTEREISKIINIVKRPILGNPLEVLLLRDIDIKLLTLSYPYKGRGVKIASVYDPDIDVQRHLIGGKVVFGNKYFMRFSIRDKWVLRQIVHRITKRRRVIDAYIELGYLDRLATIANKRKISEKIREIIHEFKDYHRLSEKEIRKLCEEVSRLKELVKREVL